jgi:hypothetical protein
MRFYLKILASVVAALGITFQTFSPHYGTEYEALTAPEDHGWSAPEAPVVQLFGAPDVPSGQGKIRLLYKDWERVTGYEYIPRHQTAPDCVGQSVAAGLDFRMAVQAAEGPHRTPQHETDASSIYGLSRVEIGDTRWSAGSTCSWAMEAVTDYGLLYKKNYLYAGYDLTEYNPGLSRTWGRQGLPSVLEKVARLTPVLEYYQVTNYEEVRDAINAGYPVVVGSNVGFSRRTFFTMGNTKGVRDSDGFLTARGTWNHAMCFVGVDDKSHRKGVCCLNSWGKSWVSGPTKLAQPSGSFWIDARTVTRMVQQDDAYAIVYVQSPLNYRLSR